MIRAAASTLTLCLFSLYEIKMKLGKLTRALLISPIGLALFLLPALLVVYIFGFRHSVWSVLVYGLLFVLFQYCFRCLRGDGQKSSEPKPSTVARV